MVDDGQRLPTQFERKIAIRNKWNSQKPKSVLPKQNSKEEKKNVAFGDTIPALNVYCKRSFNEKVEFHTKPTATLLIS